VSDPREQDDLPFERSSIAAMGARRKRGLFGFLFNGAEAAEPESEPGFESGPLHPGMLQSLAEEAGDEPPPPEAPKGKRPAEDSQGFESGPLHPGMLQALAQEAGDEAVADSPRKERATSEAVGFESGPLHPGMLQALALEAGDGPAELPREEASPSSLLALDSAAARPAAAASRRDDRSPPAPLIEHSILDQLAGLEERPTRMFPIERAILISLFAHLAIVLFLILMPERKSFDPKNNLLAALYNKPDQDTPIPISFPDAPGPARENPKRSPLSDADRRAGGGDPSKPKSETPFVPPQRGVAGLAPGPKAPRIPGSAVPSRPGATAEAQRRPPPGAPNGAADAQKPVESKTADAQPSQFPTSVEEQKRLGQPSDTTKLAGLQQAIREAARGTVGGEGGSPAPNPGGGFVDSGPLSFDTTWYDWGPYAAEMVRRIKLHWDVPELARLGWKGSLTVRFFIMADGTVADAKIVRASGIPPFDFAAFQAIVKSSPFRPLPKDLLAAVPGKDREGITVTFFYNMRMDEEEGGAPGPPKKSP
jgi:TonB family protein